MAGTGLTTTYNSIFIIANAPIIAPTVTNVDPINGAVNILSNKVIKVTFSEIIQAAVILTK